MVFTVWFTTVYPFPPWGTYWLFPIFCCCTRYWNEHGGPVHALISFLVHSNHTFQAKTASPQLSTLIKSNHCVQNFHQWNSFFLVSCLSSLKISILLGGKHLDTKVSFPLASRPAVLGWVCRIWWGLSEGNWAIISLESHVWVTAGEQGWGYRWRSAAITPFPNSRVLPCFPASPSLCKCQPSGEALT